MNFRSEESKKVITYLLFVAPALVIYLLMVGYPIIKSLHLSLTDYNVYTNEAVWTGFKWYTKMFNQSEFWMALKNTMIVVVVSVFGQIPIGFVLAYILYRKLVRFQGFFQGMVFLPITLSMVIVGILWLKMFSSVGAVTNLLRLIYNDPEYTIGMLSSKTWAMVPVAFALLWIYTGFYMVVFLANLQRINPSIVEAAMIDGASEAHIFLKVIIPSLSGVVVILTIFAIAGSLKGFDLIFALTGGGPSNYTEVLTLYMYRYAFTYFNYSFGSAISMVIVIMSIILIILVRVIQRRLTGPKEV